MSDDLIQKLRNSPPREICEHGSQRVKCDHCDNERLEIENEWLRGRIEGLLLQHQQDSTELRALCAGRDEARAELAALQARIDEAPTIIYGQSAVAGGMPYSLDGKRIALVPLDE